MDIGYLLGGIAAILYALLMIVGGVKRTGWLMKITKAKLGKNMGDETVVKVLVAFGVVFAALAIFLFLYGAIQGQG